MMRAVLLAAALCTWALPSTLRAQVLPQLQVEGCAEVDAGELGRLLEIELRTLGTQVLPARTVAVRCSGDHVLVQAALQTDASRTLELTFQSQERATLTRLLALRISELLTIPAAPVTPAAPARQEPTRAAPAREQAAAVRTVSTPRPVDRSLLMMGSGLRRLGEPAALLTGLFAGYAVRLLPHLSLRADVLAEFGRVWAELASVTYRQVGLGISLLAERRTRHVDVGAGPGFRCAWSFLRAHDVPEDHEARSLSAPWAGPFVSAVLGIHGESAWGAALSLEAGYVLVPIRGLLDQQRTLLSVDGSWFGTQLAATYSW